MKRIFTAGIIAALVGTAAMADSKGIYREILGTVTKIESDHYVITDNKGKQHTFNYDASTKKEGDIKEGSKVEVYVDKNYVGKIEVMD